MAAIGVEPVLRVLVSDPEEAAEIVENRIAPLRDEFPGLPQVAVRPTVEAIEEARRWKERVG